MKKNNESEVNTVKLPDVKWGRPRDRGWEFLPLSSVSLSDPRFPSPPSRPPVEPIAARLKEVRLQRDDFEILKVIGRGAFSEVRPEP